MLILTRHVNEEIYIYQEGDDIPLGKVMVCEIKGDKVRLGFTGESDIVFHRREVAESIEKEGRCPSLPSQPKR